ncbi:MAG: hypothetical protein ACOX8T_11070 [Bacillota bacterium]|jgi:hypothetical protein
MLTGTYTLEHASWDGLSNEDPEQIGVTQEQAQELLQLVDAEWERTVTETGREYGVELEVEWVTAFAQAHRVSLDEDDYQLAHEIETGMASALERATERVASEWSKRIANNKQR